MRLLDGRILGPTLLLAALCACTGAKAPPRGDTDIDIDVDTDSDSDTDADTDSDTDADIDVDTDVDTDADSDSDTDTRECDPWCGGQDQCREPIDCKVRPWPLACAEADGWWLCCEGSLPGEWCCVPQCPEGDSDSDMDTDTDTDTDVDTDTDTECIYRGPEECNGIDDDCNGQIDEPTPCQNIDYDNGWFCDGTERCVGGKRVCDAKVPTAEVCNGEDDNCNGGVDEGLRPLPCSREWNGYVCNGTKTCQGSQGWVCDARTPRAEECNLEDDNCNGFIDEGLVERECEYTNEHGSCTGVETCELGDWVCHAPPAGVEVCNGEDDDCDGEIDENATDEVCNGLDDDCDGTADDGGVCTCPIGFGCQGSDDCPPGMGCQDLMGYGSLCTRSCSGAGDCDYADDGHTVPIIGHECVLIPVIDMSFCICNMTPPGCPETCSVAADCVDAGMDTCDSGFCTRDCSIDGRCPTGYRCEDGDCVCGTCLRCNPNKPLAQECPDLAAGTAATGCQDQGEGYECIYPCGGDGACNNGQGNLSCDGGRCICAPPAQCIACGGQDPDPCADGGLVCSTSDNMYDLAFPTPVCTRDCSTIACPRGYICQSADLSIIGIELTACFDPRCESCQPIPCPPAPMDCSAIGIGSCRDFGGGDRQCSNACGDDGDCIPGHKCTGGWCRCQ